jgi:hypothetical protein
MSPTHYGGRVPELSRGGRPRLAPWWPLLWSTALGALLLGPGLGLGYVVRYDMVWVPDLTLRPDFLGLGSGLPRAVPSDAVVAVLDLVLPGMLLQKLVLLGSLVSAGSGAARLLPTDWLAARTAVATLAVWNPFVVERLLIGHWPVLLGYAVLPWVVVGARAWRRYGALPAGLPMVLALGSLSAGAGVVTGLLLLSLVVSRVQRRRSLTALAMVAAANAPWLVSGLLHASDARSDATGASVFALGDPGSLPGPVAALSMGGIWNGEVVPSSQLGLLGWAFVALVVGLAAVGAPSWWRATSRREAAALLGCWAVGYALAVLTWAVPDVVGAVVEAVPGGGLLRDGARWLALGAPLLLVVAGHGAQALLARLEAAPVPRMTAALALAVLPLTFLPDAALGAGGRLEARVYPPAYAAARAALAGDDAPGDVVLLPLSAYRQPAWADGTKMLDPAGRYLPRDYVASDELVVSGQVVAGEDPRVPEVADALDGGSAESRADALTGLGIGWVAVTAPGAPEVAGQVVVDSSDLRLVRLEAAAEEPATSTGWLVAMGLAWLAFASTVAVGMVLPFRRGRRGTRQVPAG